MISEFSKKLLARIPPPPKLVYTVHDPKSISFLTQLCVALSKHNFHKFKHNFRDNFNSLYTINDDIENTKHLLLLCHPYDDNKS